MISILLVLFLALSVSGSTVSFMIQLLLEHNWRSAMPYLLSELSMEEYPNDPRVCESNFQWAMV
jgi:hypothetical protein